MLNARGGAGDAIFAQRQSLSESVNPTEDHRAVTCRAATHTDVLPHEAAVLPAFDSLRGRRHDGAAGAESEGSARFSCVAIKLKWTSTNDSGFDTRLEEN